jgi:hypothetical protein
MKVLPSAAFAIIMLLSIDGELNEGIVTVQDDSLAMQ